MTYLTESDVVALPLGARVSFPKGAIAYPDFAITDPMTGTVTDKQDDATWIKIDQHHADLDEWGNLIQVWYWSDENNQAAYPMVRLYSASLDGTDMLSEFVREYCDVHSITCDGDAFGMAFSGMDNDMTEAEVASIIETTADVYGLRVSA